MGKWVRSDKGKLDGRRECLNFDCSEKTPMTEMQLRKIGGFFDKKKLARCKRS
jgi:hypothetical protein